MKSIRDKEGNQWEYIPIKEARGITHQCVVGDVLGKSRQKKIGSLRGEDGKELAIYPYKEKLGYAEKVAGYIPYDGEGKRYVRVMQRNRVRIFLPVLIVCALAGAGVFLYFQREKGPNLDEAAIAYQMPGDAKNEDPNRISLPGFGTLYMDQETGQMGNVLLNPEGNPCYFTYIITMEDSGEELYHSGMIEPGKGIKEWRIEKKLDAGTYDILIQINTADINDYTRETNGGAFKAKLEVG